MTQRPGEYGREGGLSDFEQLEMHTKTPLSGALPNGCIVLLYYGGGALE